MKTANCKNCRNCIVNTNYCDKFKFSIVDLKMAEYCEKYKEHISIQKEVKCKNCGNINKFGYCYSKKCCIDEDERIKSRHCRSYKEKIIHPISKKQKERKEKRKVQQDLLLEKLIEKYTFEEIDKHCTKD